MMAISAVAAYFRIRSSTTSSGGTDRLKTLALPCFAVLNVDWPTSTFAPVQVPRQATSTGIEALPWLVSNTTTESAP